MIAAAATKNIASRRADPPWSVEEPDRRWATSYFEEEPGRRAAAKLFTRDEAQRIAADIAKLPELLSRLP
jgi:hypothetical protein